MQTEFWLQMIKKKAAGFSSPTWKGIMILCRKQWKNNEHGFKKCDMAFGVECLDVSLSHPADCTHRLMTPRQMWSVCVIAVAIKPSSCLCESTPSPVSRGCFYEGSEGEPSPRCGTRAAPLLPSSPLHVDELSFWGRRCSFTGWCWGSVSNDHTSKAPFCTLACMCVCVGMCLCGPHTGTCIHGEVKPVHKVSSLHWCQPTRHHHDN